MKLETIGIDKEYLKIIWNKTKGIQELAKAPITGTKVGACVVGFEEEQPMIYPGFNIELSISYVYHAEEVAMIECIRDNIKPEIVFCTSKSKEERIAMCGNCRQKLLDANPECHFVIFDPDGEIKIMGKIKEYMIDNKSWGKLKFE